MSSPSTSPSSNPTLCPSSKPTVTPTINPTSTPTPNPTNMITMSPSLTPTSNPTTTDRCSRINMNESAWPTLPLVKEVQKQRLYGTYVWDSADQRWVNENGIYLACCESQNTWTWTPAGDNACNEWLIGGECIGDNGLNIFNSDISWWDGTTFGANNFACEECAHGYTYVPGDIPGGDQFGGAYDRTATSTLDCANQCSAELVGTTEIIGVQKFA